MDFGLGRISRLVRDYHKVLPWKAIHIAGTNGKGTTSRYIEALLQRSNVEVGLFNSPHLVHRHDCIRIGGTSIDKAAFRHWEEVVKQRNADCKIDATAFELLTATAFECFARAKVDVAIIECGLGGRLDATNILHRDEVLCSVITRIGLDHQDVLGHTLEKIALEKAGILKPSVPVVVDGSNQISVKQIIKQKADELAGGCGSVTISALPPRDADYDYLDNNRQLAQTVYNVALKRIDRLKEMSHVRSKIQPVLWTDQKQVLAEATKELGGRFQSKQAWEITRYNKPIILDGAHNEQAAVALRHKLDALSVKKATAAEPLIWVISMSGTKAAGPYLQALLKPNDRVIFCEFGPVDGMPWVQPQRKDLLASRARKMQVQVYIADSVEAAMRLAGHMARQDRAATAAAADTGGRPDSRIVVTGSLYLVGDVLRLLERAQEG